VKKIINNHEYNISPNADLRNANLKGADLTSVDLTNADLWYACLESTNLTSVKLIFATMWYANLQSADLTSADLTDADLSFADLSSATVTQAQLNKCAKYTIPLGFRGYCVVIPSSTQTQVYLCMPRKEQDQLLTTYDYIMPFDSNKEIEQLMRLKAFW
jgi:hypothetical protein